MLSVLPRRPLSIWQKSFVQSNFVEGAYWKFFSWSAAPSGHLLKHSSHKERFIHPCCTVWRKESVMAIIVWPALVKLSFNKFPPPSPWKQSIWDNTYLFPCFSDLSSKMIWTSSASYHACALQPHLFLWDLSQAGCTQSGWGDLQKGIIKRVKKEESREKR